MAETFKALADPQRRELLSILRGGRKSAGELADMLGISAQAMSYHLKLLRSAELVIEYREKNYIYYDINTSVFEDIMIWLRSFT